MINQNKRTIKLNRGDINKILMAIGVAKFEANDAGSKASWDKIYLEVATQLNAQDMKEINKD